jgi:hypothetical protein
MVVTGLTEVTITILSGFVFSFKNVLIYNNCCVYNKKLQILFFLPNSVRGIKEKGYLREIEQP